MKPKRYLFSESYENYTADSYIKEGDDGPWFEVVPSEFYDDLKKQAEFMHNTLRSIAAAQKIKIVTLDFRDTVIGGEYSDEANRAVMQYEQFIKNAQ